MNHLEKLKKTFDEIGVPYVLIIEGEYSYIYTCSEEEQKNNKLLTRNVFFEFYNGELASSP
jgi:hypothetical protein